MASLETQVASPPPHDSSPEESSGVPMDETAAPINPPTTQPSAAASSPSPSSSSSSSSSSLFTAKLHRELLKMPDLSWRHAFIDYQRLRKQIKKIVYYEQEAKQQTNTTATPQRLSPSDPSSSTPSPSSLPPPPPSSTSTSPSLPPVPISSTPPPPTLTLPTSSAHRIDRLRKARDVFWCVLKAEIDKVNTFFTSKEDEALKQFKSIALDTPDDPSSLPSTTSLDTDRLIFAKLLLTHHPKVLAERLLSPGLLHLASSVDWATFPPSRVSRVSAFLALCGLVDSLRKFVVINYVVVLKVLKKYEEYTHRNAKEEFLQEVDHEPSSTSARLAVLLKRAEAITFKLLVQTEEEKSEPVVKTENSVAAPTSSSPCPICRQALINPVQLQCGHRCCFTCLSLQTITSTRSFACPVCNAQQEFDSLDLGLESVLTKFAGVSLTDREKMEGQQLYSYQQADGKATPDSSHNSSLSDAPRMKSEGGEMGGSEGVDPSSMSPASVHRRLLLESHTIPFDMVGAKDEGGDGESEDDESDSDSEGRDGSIHPSSSRKQATASGADVSDHRKFGRGSCHQCKTTRDSKLLLCCTSKAEKGKRKRKCRKKYCSACLQRTYAQVMSAMTPQEISRWQCPACVGICTCAACQRRGKETALENVGLPPPLNIPAELLANDPWAYALHSSSTAAQQAQQAAAAAAQALVQQHVQAAAAAAAAHQGGQAGQGNALALSQLNGIGGSGGYGIGMNPQSLDQSGLLNPNHPLNQLQQSLAILQSLANAPNTSSAANSLTSSLGLESRPPSSSLNLSTLSGLSPVQLAALNAVAVQQLQQQAQSLTGFPQAFNPLLNPSPMELQLLAQYLQPQDQQNQWNPSQSQSSSPSYSPSIPSNDLLAAQAAAASSRERYRSSHARDEAVNEESRRMSKLGAAALNFQAPPPFFLSSHSPASPLLHSPTLSRPASPLSPLSPSSSHSPSNSPQVRQRSIANLRKISTTRNLSLSVPSKTRSIAIGVGRGREEQHSPAAPLEDPHSLLHQSAVPPHVTGGLDQFQSSLLQHASPPSHPGPLNPIVTAIGGEDMPSFHTGSTPLSVPSRTRTISDRSSTRPRSSSGRRSVEHRGEGEGDSPHSPFSPQQLSSNVADLTHPSHLTHLPSMSSRNPNKSLLQQQQQLSSIGSTSSPSPAKIFQSPRRSSFGSSSSSIHPGTGMDGSSSTSGDIVDEVNAKLQQQMELERANRLQLQLFSLQQAQQAQQAQYQQSPQGQGLSSSNFASPSRSSSRPSNSRSANRRLSQSLSSQEQLQAHSNALNVLDHYQQLSSQASQHHQTPFVSPLYQHTSQQSGLSHSPSNSSPSNSFFSPSSYSAVSNFPSDDPFSSSSSLQYMFDRQSSFQMPDTLPSFNPFTSRDTSMEPRGISALGSLPSELSTSSSQSSHLSTSANPRPTASSSTQSLPSSDPFDLDAPAPRLSSGGDFLVDLSSANAMDLSRGISGLAIGMDIGGGGGGGGGMTFDRSLSALLGTQQHPTQSYGQQGGGGGEGGSGVSPGSSLSASTGSSQSLQLSSHPSSSISHTSTSPSSSAEFDDDLTNELYSLQHESRGLSAAGFDLNLNLERYPSAVSGLSAAFSKEGNTNQHSQQQSHNTYGSQW